LARSDGLRTLAIHAYSQLLTCVRGCKQVRDQRGWGSNRSLLAPEIMGNLLLESNVNE
jgi:hypothetical protein